MFAVISASIIALLPAPVGAAPGDLLLIDQNFDVAADGSLNTTVGLPTDLAGGDLSTATIAVTVYPRITDRAAFVKVIAGTLSPPVDSVTISPPQWTESPLGQLVFSTPLETDNTRPDALSISRSGLYPVMISLKRDSAAISEVLTFLNRLPATAAGLAETDPISVALAIGTHSTIHLDSNATTTLDGTAVDKELTSLADTLQALDASAMRATVRLAPAVVAGLQQLDPALFARLMTSLAKQQIIAEPRWPLDASAAAAVGQDSLYTSWLRNGEDSLAALVPTPISRSMIFVDQPISAAGASLQRNLGARMMVMTPGIYDGLTGSIGLYSDYSGQLIAADLPNDTAFDTAVVDHQISDLLAHPLATPMQTAIYVVAHLLALQQSFETAGDIPQRHAVVIATPDLGVPSATLIGPIASLIEETPGLAAASLDDVALRADRVLLPTGEESQVTLPTVDGTVMSRRVFIRATLDNEIGDVAAMLPASDERPADWRSLADTLPTTALNDSDATSMVSDVRSKIAQIRGAVQVPAAFTISLAGRRSTVRIRFVNTSAVPLAIKATLSSPSGKLVFTNDDQPVVLPPGPTEINFQVEARSNGTSGVSLDVFTPNDVRLAPTVPLKVRVNALGVGNIITVALFALVLLWWFEHTRAAWRERRRIPPANLPAS